jgi:LysM repeat protein
MKPLTQRNSAVVVLLMAALVVAACTRSASTGVVPTATTAPQGVAGGNEPQPTDAMNALGTALALNITQTAIAQSSTGGGETPQPPSSGQLAVTPTPVPTTAVPPAAGATPTAGAACTSPYTVKQGDWIYKIARDCKVTPSAIIAANPGISPNFIIPGQKLNLPTAGATSVPAATAQAQACKGTYTVKSGDNLFRIAFNCGLTTEQMAAANGIAFPYIIHPGDVLKFP